MKELDIKWLQEYAEQEKRYKWGKQIKLLLTAYEKEKEKNKDLKEGYKIQEHNYQVAMEEIEQRWVDKIKAKIEKWDKDIKWNNADDHYYAIKMMQSLLEKE